MSPTTMLGFLGPDAIARAERALGMRNITAAGTPATDADDPARCTRWLTPAEEADLDNRLVDAYVATIGDLGGSVEMGMAHFGPIAHVTLPGMDVQDAKPFFLDEIRNGDTVALGVPLDNQGFPVLADLLVGPAIDLDVQASFIARARARIIEAVPAFADATLFLFYADDEE